MKFVDLTPAEIVNVIRDDILVHCPHAKDATYVILGRPGPTGKTWLFNSLRCHLGLKNVVEISEDINEFRGGLVDYYRGNYFIYNRHANHAVIVLNNMLNLHKKERAEDHD